MKASAVAWSMRPTGDSTTVSAKRLGPSSMCLLRAPRAGRRPDSRLGGHSIIRAVTVPATSPAISVVMPVRDAARTLAAAVESVLAQTETDWELVAVDDG